ncbi:MAG: hypothetical protein M3O20_03990 [Acidobacteriota bacterium]|nr:hypothetical protein [Acidobacteriota bacterium]
MRITRREFAYGIAGSALAARAAGQPLIYERRVYAPGSTLPRPEILERHGIRPVFVKGSEYLIPFASFAERARAWDLFNNDENWCELRDAGNVSLEEIQIYPGGKIFEMSL